jgi:nucleosome binding factor SPN SPT16 subunit
LLPTIETVIDEEQKVTHAELAAKTEEVFEDPTRISKKLHPESVDSCYSPFIQSGGVYDLRPWAVLSNNEQLHFGTIVCALGARFKSYCSNVGRTYFVDPNKDQEANYKILLEIQQILLKSLKPGVKLSVLHSKAIKFLETKKPELLDKFTKNCGYSMGIEFQESLFTINAKNERVVEAGMVFNLTVGFQNLENPSAIDKKKKIYAMLLSDTVLVKEDGEAGLLEQFA